MQHEAVKSQEELPLILTMKDVMDIMGISKDTAYKLPHMEGFPVVYFGRTMRVPRDTFFAWIERQVQPIRKTENPPTSTKSQPKTLGNDGLAFPQTMDASIWTQVWMEMIAARPAMPSDYDTMLDWFYNAIMAGFDAASRCYDAKAHGALGVPQQEG